VAAAFREAIRLRADYAEAHNNLGLVLIQSGNDEEGIAALREAVRLAPAYAEARTNLGAALTPTDAEAAIKELEEAVRLAPGSVKALFNLAVAYGAGPADGHKKEIEHLERVIEMAPDFPRAHLALGKARLRDGQVPGAITALEEATRLEPAGGEAHYQLGLALARAGRRDEAAVALKKGRDLVAESDRVQNAALDFVEGRAALDRGDFAEAVTRLRRAVQVRPDSPDVHRALGTALEKQGDRKGAAAAYRRAIELNPADDAAQRSLASLTAVVPGIDDMTRVAELETYIREGKYADVEPLLAAYVKERPQSSWGWYAIGYSQFAQQKIGDSIKALARSLQLDIRNAEAHKILGRNLMIIGRFDAARLEFEQAIRYKPDSAESHSNLGKLYSIQDNWEPARKALESAIQIDPQYIEAIAALGFALEALGEDEAAVAHYRQAVALNDGRKGSFPGGHVNLSAFYNRTGDPAKAHEHATAAIAIDPEADRAWFQKGRADERLGNMEDAVKALNQAIVFNPNASSYYYVLAGVYRRLGWMDESRKALDEFKRLEKESSELEKLRRNVDAAAPPGRKRD
jgi:Flp pilus assembly protein TadD